MTVSIEMLIFICSNINGLPLNSMACASTIHVKKKILSAFPVFQRKGFFVFRVRESLGGGRVSFRPGVRGAGGKHRRRGAYGRGNFDGDIWRGRDGKIQVRGVPPGVGGRPAAEKTWNFCRSRRGPDGGKKKTPAPRFTPPRSGGRGLVSMK
jgi:hypothetical protein